MKSNQTLSKTFNTTVERTKKILKKIVPEVFVPLNASFRNYFTTVIGKCINPIPFLLQRI